MPGLLLGLMLLLLVVGVPIYVAIGITSMASMVFVYQIALPAAAQILYDSLTPFPLMAVPFFIMSANLMREGGIAIELIRFGEAWVGHLPGGLAIASVLASMIFAAISGSSVATAMAIGLISIPAMVEAGYDRRFALGLVAASGTLGILIPPSIPLILYGFMTSNTTGTLFAAGMVPGIVAGLSLMAVAMIISIKRGYGEKRHYTWAQRLWATWHAVPSLLLPVMVLGGIYSGVFTPTEASVVSVVYAVVIGVVVYRKLTFRNIVTTLGESMKQASMLMLILGSAMLLGYVVTLAQIPQHAIEAVIRMNLSANMFLLVIGLILLVLGCFMEVTSMLLILTPLLYPITQALHIDAVQFAIMFVLAMELGLITPPIGMNLYVVASTGKGSISDAVRGVVPFGLVLVILMWIVAYVPILSLWLPRILQHR